MAAGRQVPERRSRQRLLGEIERQHPVAGAFGVALIPYTLEVTTLGSAKVGDPVNLEVDVLAKYVEGLMRGTT